VAAERVADVQSDSRHWHLREDDMREDRDPPIEDPGFLSGVTVVDIGDIRVARGLTRRHSSSCPHRNLVYDDRERRIWCKDCEKDVEAFDAFKQIVSQHSAARGRLERREVKLKEAEAFQVRSLAAKEIDKAWRHRSMVPACPHCGHGLFPEDFKHGCPAMLGREYATALAKRDAKK
jgi:hypothetical protein